MQSIQQQFLTWCRSKPADEGYDYGSNDNCAFAQFLKDTGICSTPSCGGTYWRDASLSWPQVEHPFSKPLDHALAGFPYTFGSLADRLEAALS